MKDPHVYVVLGAPVYARTIAASGLQGGGKQGWFVAGPPEALHLECSPNERCICM